MSVPSKSIDKNKRYAGVKANDFVNKTRTNERSRAAAPSQGWANLGKINSRRIPPPANLPSLKSETGASTASFDPILPPSGPSHGWSATGNQTPTSNQIRPLTPSKQPTQQQLDSLPAHVSTPSLPPSTTQSAFSSDLDKPRVPATWSTITANNTTGHSQDQPPNLLGLKDFPRLATQDSKTVKSSTDSLIHSVSTTNTQGPSFRPANLSSWKEGGGRIQPISTDLTKDSNENANLSAMSSQSSLLSTNTSSLQQPMANSNNSSYMRMYPQQQQQSSQTWTFNVANPYGSYGHNQSSGSMSTNQTRHQPRISSFGHNNTQSHQTRQTTSTDYKTPTILRNKDIDDLSKLTDNVTWASASQEVNYEEKIRFSDDEDAEPSDASKSRRYNSQNQSRQTYPSQVLQKPTRSLQTNFIQPTRSRLIQDDEHVKQMQDDKNSELINTLTVAKQRRDEQERHLRHKPYEETSSQRTKSNPKSFEENKQIPGYQTRPLLASTGQADWGQTNNSASTTAPRTRHDTTDSQSFTMKSWSDQMDSFNYASLHEKPNGQVDVDSHANETTAGVTSGTADVSNKYSRSQSESSSQSQRDNDTTIGRSKHFPLSTRKQPKSIIIPSKCPTRKKTTDVIDYFDEQQINPNDQWTDWDDSAKQSSEFVTTDRRYQPSYTNDRRRQPQIHSEDLADKSTRYNQQTNENTRTKPPSKTRIVSRPSDVPPAKPDTKSVPNKSQTVWRPLSPSRPTVSNDPTPQEAITYKSQIKSTEQSNNDRRQSAPAERKSRYSTNTTAINTSSIPPLMSVRSDVPTPSTTTGTKHFKTSNVPHYSQRNEFYPEGNDSTWGNEDDYYEDETGYYDSTNSTNSRHQQSMAYHSNSHHRGYTTLGSYGRYRRAGTIRHQQQYPTYNSSGGSSQLNTSLGAKTKKIVTNRTTIKKLEESPEQSQVTVESPKVVQENVVKKPLAWTNESKPTIIEEIPIIKSSAPRPISNEIESTNDTIHIVSEPKPLLANDNSSQIETESTTIDNKKATTTASSQKKTNHDQRYQNQQAPRHRNTYGRSMQDYESMQMSADNYYGTTRRGTRSTRGARMHDLSSGYYYGHSQQRYNNQYDYSTEHYQPVQHQTRSNNKTVKRGISTGISDHQQNKPLSSTGTSGNTTNVNLRHHSGTDNEQKEGEEWETASESSTNMRNGHHENTQPPIKSTANEPKIADRDRTPPKKSFSSQRPLTSRHNENVVHRRAHNLYDRGSKITRGVVHRSTRLSTNPKSISPPTTDGESKGITAMKKDQHRHSLDGYDLNNVAGVVKIETLPASALEEESSAFDDGGEEFCLVMSKRDRKEQKAAQLSKQNAIESIHTTTHNGNSAEPTSKSLLPAMSIENDDQLIIEKFSSETSQNTTTRARNGKSLPPRFNSKSANQKHPNKTEHQNASMYYYDQNNYYYYNQNQYYDQDSYYTYGNYNTTQRQAPVRRKTRTSQLHETTTPDEHLPERKHEPNLPEKNNSLSTNVMSNIDMWDPHTDSTITNSNKLFEKPIHDRKFGNEMNASSSNDAPLPLHPRTATELPTHSPMSKTHETIARTIKPPATENKSDRENKSKSANYDKNATISSLGPNQLFEKNAFLDYDDKQSMGTVGDDYNQKINSLKTIWDTSEHPSGQLEQTINTMVAMQQQKQQDNTVQSNNVTKTDVYVKETIAVSSANISGPTASISSATNDDTNKNKTSSTKPSANMNQPANYSTNVAANKNEQKNICTVKPTQQVAPNIQDQVDVTTYPSFPVAALQPVMSQASLQQQQQHILPQAQMNPLHQQHTYPFYDNLLLPPQQQPQQQQQQFNRYPPQNFPFRSTNMYMQPPPSVPNTNSMYHHASQGSISAPPQNNTMPPPMPNYTSPFLLDHGGHLIGQPQPQPPPPQAYMNSQMMSGRPQGAQYYRTQPQQQLQTSPGPPYGTQDALAHGGFYPPFFQPPNSNAPPVGHPSAHNIYGQNDGFHPGHPAMFARGGSMDRADHPLMSQSLSRPTSYPSSSSNQQQQGPPPSLLSQNLKSFQNNQQANSSVNPPSFYPPPSQGNQYGRQPMPIGAMNTTNNRQQTQQVPSLMSGLTKNFGNNGNNSQSLFQHRQPLMAPQSNNNRSLYQQPTQYASYSKSTGPNDDNMKPKHI